MTDSSHDVCACGHARFYHYSMIGLCRFAWPARGRRRAGVCSCEQFALSEHHDPAH